MKKLSKKAFWTIILGGAASFTYFLINIILALANGTKGIDFSEYEQIYPNIEKMVNDLLVGICVTALIINILFFSYFLLRLLKNRKADAKQGYITFLFVINIIGMAFSVISLVRGNVTALLDLAFQATILVGSVMQKQYHPPRESLEDVYISPFQSGQDQPDQSNQNNDVFPNM